MGSHAVFSCDKKLHETTFPVLRNCLDRAKIQKRHQNYRSKKTCCKSVMDIHLWFHNVHVFPSNWNCKLHALPHWHLCQLQPAVQKHPKHKTCKWSHWPCHTLKPKITSSILRATLYLGQFAAKAIETWVLLEKHLSLWKIVPMATNSFSDPSYLIYLRDFQFDTH